MRYTVEVTIDEQGEVTFEIHGVKGRGCLKILDELAKAMGVAKAAAMSTKEMHEQVVTATKVRR